MKRTLTDDVTTRDGDVVEEFLWPLTRFPVSMERRRVTTTVQRNGAPHRCMRSVVMKKCTVTAV
uniref:Uncharacterized protein n=1 Tax=Pristionchus pacificus TaxID=54126 RepID=A0A2A6BHX1_PRIPA|eukprot:PDM65489.1 hypothetical protein PRIPAC_52431 [Pristionchus pacificus]